MATAVRHVVLVHGTWGRRSPWTRADSLIWRSLERRVGATMERFEWSGRNTHRARVQAALVLEKRLDELRGEDVVIVAHSHGGNVALAAARLAPRTERLRALVALGTPFLTFGRQVKRLPAMVATLMAGGFVAYILALIGLVPRWLPIAVVSVASVLVAASLYSVISTHGLPDLALDAMVGFRMDQFPAVEQEPARLTPRSFDLAEPPTETYRGHRHDFPAVPTEVVAFPSDEAGAALAAGQFMGLLSGTVARVVNAFTLRTAFGVYAGAIIGLVVIFWILVASVLAIPVLAFLAAGDLPGAIDRLLDMREAEWSAAANPVFDLVESAFPGWMQKARDWTTTILPDLWPAVGGILIAIPLVILVPVVILSLLFTVLLIEALTIGFDGALFMWRHPITAVAAPVGTSRVSLLPVTLAGSGGLAHSHLTMSPEAVAVVADAVDRLFKIAPSAG